MIITHTASREEWLAARLDLLAKEKAGSWPRWPSTAAHFPRWPSTRSMCSSAPTARWR
jgi:hypothetical protein